MRPIPEAVSETEIARLVAVFYQRIRQHPTSRPSSTRRSARANGWRMRKTLSLLVLADAQRRLSWGSLWRPSAPARPDARDVRRVAGALRGLRRGNPAARDRRRSPRTGLTRVAQSLRMGIFERIGGAAA